MFWANLCLQPQSVSAELDLDLLVSSWVIETACDIS